MTIRFPMAIFVVALAARAALFAFNELYFSFDPYWSWQARASLILVLSDFGAISLGHDFEILRQMSAATALNAWPVMDRGLAYIHMLLAALFGSTSYQALQIFQIAIDALLVFPVMSITYSLSRSLKTACWIGVLYGVFLPQAWLAAQPGYNVWLTTGYILATWSYLKITGLAAGDQRGRSLALYGAALLAVMMIVVQIRSTIIFLPLGMAAWWWATTLLTSRSLSFPRRNWPPALVLVGVGMLVIGINGALNKVARDDASPVRSTLGHAFWTGVGQYENPLGIQDNDGSVARFYMAGSGVTEVDSTTGGVDYNSWLTRRAVRFVKENPALYASMVARRALAIVLPNMPFTLVTDKPAYDATAMELTRTRDRIALQRQYGKLSPTTLGRLVADDPFYVVGLFARLALMALLPLGLVLFFIFSERRALGLLAMVPLAYHVITLSPIYVTPIILIPAYTAVLPVVGVGWALALSKLLGRKGQAVDV